MSDENSLSHHDLVPASPTGIASQASGLVERGLRLAESLPSPLDFIPLTLSYEDDEGVAIPIIERNTAIPVERVITFSSDTARKLAAGIHLMQGERPFARNNKTLGHFYVEGIQWEPPSTPSVEVSFRIDEYGILTVTARVKNAKRGLKIIWTEKGHGTSGDEVSRLLAEARENYEEDRRLLTELRQRRRKQE